MDGRAYMERSSILHQVYAFDNIACDGLQICQYYIELLSSLQKNKQNEDAYTDKHQLETLSCLGEFYLYEVVHQLKIMISIYGVIDTNPNLYISLSDTDLIDSYRVNNFIRFTKNINDFVQQYCNNKSIPQDLKTDLYNINSIVTKWTNVNVM